MRTPVVTGPDGVSDELLARLVEMLISEHTEAIVVVDSTARRHATPYSDVDIAHIVAPCYTGREKWFHYRDGVLVSVSARTMEWWRHALRVPERAIFVVPAMREARVLVDPAGTFASYREQLAGFSGRHCRMRRIALRARW